MGTQFLIALPLLWLGGNLALVTFLVAVSPSGATGTRRPGARRALHSGPRAQSARHVSPPPRSARREVHRSCRLISRSRTGGRSGAPTGLARALGRTRTAH